MSAESERLIRGPRPGERPGGLGLTRMNFVADGDAAAVVDRARDVMLRLAGLPASAFNDVATGDLLPRWFLAAFTRQPLAGQCPQDGDWTLEGWLYWADSGRAALALVGCARRRRRPRDDRDPGGGLADAGRRPVLAAARRRRHRHGLPGVLKVDGRGSCAVPGRSRRPGAGAPGRQGPMAAGSRARWAARRRRRAGLPMAAGSRTWQVGVRE